jgi:hypothetical protein
MFAGQQDVGQEEISRKPVVPGITDPCYGIHPEEQRGTSKLKSSGLNR